MKRRDFVKFGLAGAGTLALVKNVSALEYYPTPSDEEWAVIYSTWCGSARDAAVWISEGMGGIANVFDVRENPDPAGFDNIIIGGAIRSSVTRQELQDYITLNKELLQDKVRGLFAVCGNMGNPVGPEQTEMFIDNHLAQLCGVSDLPSKVFLGRITKSLMDSETAQMMAGFDDYDNLDRSDCMAFGQEVLDNMSTSIEKIGSGLPQGFRLNQNDPNPFNADTKICYNIPEATNVKLAIYTMTGKRVTTLVSGHQQAGRYKVTWDGSRLETGSYLYRLEAGNITRTRKALLVR
ncbi:MAG: T9SS type A sorting domain-containing protein [Bacteroidales bacterium]|nr:MAG: T9SS type A sorting domain-containing protein [Bacteroidales bacterium]